MMNKKNNGQVPGRRRTRQGFYAFIVGILAAFSSTSVMSVEISSSPLYLGSDVPGNLVLVPSVEYPTIHSQANIGNYNHSRRYSGYFDPEKCYAYNYHSNEANRHFYPTGMALSFECSVQDEWSGNYMNWVATQTIDPFRAALTGGYRVRDTTTETWLEKARHAPGYGLYPDRRMPNSGDNNALVHSVTGANWWSIHARIRGLGNRMWFTANGNLDSSAGVVAYNPAVHPLRDVPQDRERVYEVSVRVKVCDPSVGVEENCNEYSQGWKPEGLIQEYSERIRYSIFGFLNETGNQRDGGVMRARQKFVGPSTHYPDQGQLANANREWDHDTGVFVRNPDPIDADATGHGVVDSGVINYLNKFGQMTSANPKGNDPVSELYYAALRYFRGQGNLSSYTNGLNYDRTDGFPVITDWDDPIKYACQVNAALGIGDVYTHADHDVPTGDLELARQYTQKILDLEGISRSASSEFSGRGNSAYIAGLAYYANTNDLRPDTEAEPNSLGRQTLSTYWVDVRENQRLEPKSSNQYWLAAKYGGFRVPEGFDPLATTGLNQAWWHNSGEYLVSGQNGDVTTSVTSYPRPDNFYVASEADKMVASLRTAFENIVAGMRGSSSAFARNTSRLESGAKTFQSQFFSGEWGGELLAFDVDPATGALIEAWQATSNFPLWGPTNSTMDGGGQPARQVYFNSGGSLAAFQHGALGSTPLGSASQSEINYLRGDRSQEAPGGTLRARRSVLGDIVNSQPVYVGSPNVRLHLGRTYAGASAYPNFVASQASRTPVVYVGANDGMLHAFNANTGREIFAFMPTAAMQGLAGDGGYTSQNYVHRYFVDGDIAVADVFYGGSWKTVLVGSMGRGGRSLFALNVTNPSNPQLLWERSASQIPAMGNNIGPPVIAQVADGDWRVFVGNGPNGAGGNAQLVMIEIDGGSHSVINAGGGGNNGLSGINVWASTSSGFADTVYAGDLKGNLWKFTDLTGTGENDLLFAAGTTQPISAAPLVARNPSTGETWVFVGTGQYLNADDLANTDLQSWYGLIDKGSEIQKSNLKEVKILAEGIVAGRAVRTIEANTAPGSSGWYMDLKSSGEGGDPGERMVVPNFFQGLTLIGTTRIPDVDDVCSPSGKGFTMAIDPFTGGRLSSSFFDVDGDGSFNSGDTLDGVPVSGIGYSGSPNNPVFLGDQMYTGLDDGSSDQIGTSASASNLRRVSWREIIREE